MFIVVIGYRGGRAAPLIQKSQDLGSELADARLGGRKKKVKVAMLPSMREKEKQLKKIFHRFSRNSVKSCPA